MVAIKDSRLAVRLSTDQRALIGHAADAVGSSVTDFTVAAAVARAEDVLADRRVFVLGDAAWRKFLVVLDRPVTHKPRLEKLFSEPSIFEK
jgi:uncharacterized protein (DUF1778 family)